MPITDLDALLEHELGDLYFAEKTILKALKKMTREVSNPDVRARMEAHQGETEEQIANLERAFQALGKRAKAEKCPGILGIIQEHDDFASDEEPTKPMLEAFDLGSGLRVEHYEIAAYHSALAVAKTLGEREVASLLKANLEQEVAMARFLETSAAGALKLAQQNATAEAERAAARDARKGGPKSAAKSAAKSASRSTSKSASKSGAKSAATRAASREESTATEGAAS